MGCFWISFNRKAVFDDWRCVRTANITGSLDQQLEFPPLSIGQGYEDCAVGKGSQKQWRSLR